MTKETGLASLRAKFTSTRDEFIIAEDVYFDISETEYTDQVINRARSDAYFTARDTYYRARRAYLKGLDNYSRDIGESPWFD